MKRLIVFLVALVLIPLLVALIFTRVPPATIGVKVNKWGGGVVEKDYDTGYHVGVTGLHEWHFLPERTHFVHFTGRRTYDASSADRYVAPLEIRTKDNNVVTFELSVAYRILEGEGYVIIEDGYGASYRDRVVSTLTAGLRDELAKLSSEELQVTDLRVERVEETLPVLNEKVAEFHCVATGILVRRLQFQPTYEEKLQEKQYLRQKALLDEAETRVAEEEKRVNLIEKQIVAAEKELNQDWEKRIQEKRSEYDVLIAEIRAEAEVYAQETRAEGDAERVIAQSRGRLALEQAEALRDELRTEALNSEGGRILLALDAAQNLNLPNVTLNSDDPAVPMILDLKQLTELLVGTPLPGQAAGQE